MALHRSESSPLSHQVRLERLSISLIFLISHSKSDVKINLDCRFKRKRARQRNRCMKRRSIEDFIHRSSSLEHFSGYKPADLKECILSIHDLQLSKRASSLVAVREKYRQHQFKCVSKLSSPQEIPNSYFEDVRES